VHLGFALAVWPGAVDRLAGHHRQALPHFGAQSWVVRLGSTVQLEALSALSGDTPGTPPLDRVTAGIADAIPHFAAARAFAPAMRARAAGDHHDLRAAIAPLVARPGGFGVVLAPLLASSYRELSLMDDLRELQRVLDAWPPGPPGAPVLDVTRVIVRAELDWAEGRLDDAAAGFATALESHPAIVSPAILDPGCELAVLRFEQGRHREGCALLAARLALLAGRQGSPGRVAAAGPGLGPLIDSLAEGSDPHAARVAELLGRRPAPAPRLVPSTGATLTPREVEVLRLLAAGASNAQLGEHLHISHNTVKTHVKRVLAKLGASSRSEAVAVARSQHLL
jgi:DNA-binding CsgD family transcriptional regulator